MTDKFQSAKIYMIWSPHTEKVYVGSTTQRLLCMRMAKHRNCYKNYLEGKMNYLTSFEILELGDAKIELIENFPCNSKEELRAREGFYIRKENCVNRCVAGRTSKEYAKEYEEKFRELSKKRYEENKEEIRENRKETDRKYREKNREILRERSRKWCKENKDRRKEILRKYNSKRVRCSCGCSVSYSYLSNHKKSQKHKQTLLNSYNIFNHL